MGKGGIDEKKTHLVALASHAREVALLCVLANKKAKFIEFADQYKDMPGFDSLLWQEVKKLHNAEAHVTKIPVVGDLLKGLVSKVEGSEEAILRQEYFFLRHKLLFKHFVQKLAQNPKPVVTTIPLVAFALEEHGYSEQITLVVDQVTRRHVALEPKKSLVEYKVFSEEDKEALLMFGVKSKQVHRDESSLVDKKTLTDRFSGLDKEGVIATSKKTIVEALLGRGSATKIKRKRRRSLTIGFNGVSAASISELTALAAGLSRQIRGGEVKLVVWAGNDAESLKRIRLAINKVRLNAEIKKGTIELVWDADLAKASTTWMGLVPKLDLMLDSTGDWCSLEVADVLVVAGTEYVSACNSPKVWLEKGLESGAFAKRLLGQIVLK